ncbi:FAD-binding oxidoreductase [Nonomuraea typhae]|uniref:FAD-binding oxidoreductase n=1 Tax=Nonomuraea typhae TaxID=2603600 RepID=UPI0012FBF694|nr:FAD-binding oxidoreductase [Nonomuraea typhae]
MDLLPVAPTPWNLAVTHHPAGTVVATSAAHVQEAVRHAAAHGLRVRVHNTGHGALRPATGDDLLVVTSELTGVEIDPVAGLATVGAGVRWRDVIAAADPHGLTPLTGSSTGVGAVGNSLGGGLGFLSRQYGLACDAITAAQIVTADGTLRRVDDASEPDLLWALRGGGPNLGVVVELRIKLVREPRVYGGALLWPVELARQVLTAYRDWTADLPVSVTSAAGVLHCPDAPFVPEPMRGRSFARVCLCATGSDAEALVAPMRAVPGLVGDTAGPIPFTAIDVVTQDPVEPLPITIRGEMVAELSDSVIDYLVEVAPRGAEPYVFTLARHVAGMPHADDAGLGYWQGGFAVGAVCLVPDETAMEAVTGFGRRFSAGLAGSATGFVPLNFMGDPEQAARAFTPEHLRRLTEVKRRYDPDGMFGGDRSIPAKR